MSNSSGVPERHRPRPDPDLDPQCRHEWPPEQTAGMPLISATSRPTPSRVDGSTSSARPAGRDSVRDRIQHERGGDDQAADEPAAGLVVSSQQQEQREQQQQRHQDARRSLQNRRMSRAPLPSDEQQRSHTDRDGDEHGDLSERVEPAEVDQDDVHHVAPVSRGAVPRPRNSRTGATSCRTRR